MTVNYGGDDLELLVVAASQSFGSAVADAVEKAAPEVGPSVGDVHTLSPPLSGGLEQTVDGAVVDGQVTNPATVVERLIETQVTSVAVLIDPTENAETIPDAIEAGATDVFPRTTASAQYELIVEQIASESTNPLQRDDTTAEEQPYYEVFENVSDGLVVHDPDTGEILNINERFCEMTGYDREELVGESVDLVIADDEGYSYDRAKRLIRQARDEGSNQFEWRNRHQDGHTYPVEVHLTLVELGGAERVLASVRDITERRRREREYEQIFNMAGDGIVIHDPGSGDVVDANEQIADLLGYDREAFFDRPLSEFQATDEGISGQDVRNQIQESVDAGQREFEWPLETSGGEKVWVRARHETGEIDGERRIVALLHDITERKRREREFEQIFDGVNDAIAIHDGQTGELLKINERLCELTGYERDQVLELGIEGLVCDHPDQDYGPEEIPEIIERVLHGEDVAPYEQAIETRGGTVIWVEVNPTRAVIDGEDRVLTISRDITERRRREQEYEQIFNSVQDAIIVHDPETKEMVDVNTAACELTGYDRGTLLELGTAGVSVNEEGYTQDRAEAVINEVMETGQKGPFEWKIETKNGEKRITEVVATTAEIGGELRHVSINRDITERKRREQEYEQIFNNVEDSIIIYDPDSLDVVTVNEAYLDLFGYESRSAIREQGVSGLSVTDKGYTEERGMEVVQRVVEQDRPEVIEWQAKTRDGERIWLEIKVAPGVIGGERRAICINRDITERKRREQRLEVFNRILRHNLRNQLDVIRSYAETLADQTGTSHADRIIAAVDELAAIGAKARETDRILSMEDSPTQIDLAAVVRGSVEEMAPTRDDVVVTTEVPNNAPLQTTEDAVEIALKSSLENALEHAESAVSIAVEQSPDGYIVTIGDDGPGIPEEELLPIETGTETTHRHSRGLGLWQLRWSVNKLNGELSFETDGGTIVRITIPGRD